MNFCRRLHSLPAICKQYELDSFVFVSEDEKSCFPLLELKNHRNIMQLVSKENVLDGFLVKNPNTDFDLEITCNPTAVSPSFIPTTNGLKISSQEGCGMLNRPGLFIDKHKTEMIVLMFIIGMGLLFFGGYDWDLLLIFTGFGIGFCLNFSIYISMANINESFFLHFLILLLSAMMGCLMAFSFYQLSFLGETIIGFITGFLFVSYLLFYLDVNISHVS